jgi:rubredoxin
MGLLDGFEKLINEHGSAAILKERITLANDKYSALEKKYAELEVKYFDSERQNRSLESENETLRLDNAKHREQVRNLEEQLVELIHKPILLFDEKSGTWFEENKTTRYCPKCKALASLSPMRNELTGWFCPVCSLFCGNHEKKMKGPINIDRRSQQSC